MNDKTPASRQLLDITKALLDDANAEIERLRACEIVAAEWAKRCVKHGEEIDRLQGALDTCRELRQWDRAAVIEECAQAVTGWVKHTEHPVSLRAYEELIAVIRALKQ